MGTGNGNREWENGMGTGMVIGNRNDWNRYISIEE